MKFDWNEIDEVFEVFDFNPVIASSLDIWNITSFLFFYKLKKYAPLKFHNTNAKVNDLKSFFLLNVGSWESWETGVDTSSISKNQIPSENSLIPLSERNDHKHHFLTDTDGY